ncbi:hypothetical protein HPB50_008215 [Hyalomma asiaticum]|uniref:Uncharacterized protein n=1 Tax=Hyalomma asiaticum TaxID=266040 RepID=A0ACB7TJ50_HYAAI|nr:hypothetical protein HPB50_008215 [Hyalomma asiaticum]
MAIIRTHDGADYRDQIAARGMHTHATTGSSKLRAAFSARPCWKETLGARGAGFQLSVGAWRLASLDRCEAGARQHRTRPGAGSTFAEEQSRCHAGIISPRDTRPCPRTVAESRKAAGCRVPGARQPAVSEAASGAVHASGRRVAETRKPPPSVFHLPAAAALRCKGAAPLGSIKVTTASAGAPVHHSSRRECAAGSARASIQQKPKALYCQHLELLWNLVVARTVD